LAAAGKPLPELKQVWFPGVHINSGGGADDAISEMKGDLEHISTATFAWMLQCISSHLTLDQDAFHASLLQYERWRDRVRYACTYHHPGWSDWAKSKVPKIPFINPAVDPLAPPKRDATHTHPDFDYGYGTGPIVDSYGGMYYLNGELRRVPGHCQAEIYDPESDEHKLRDIYEYGETNEYIHPICHYRDIIRGPEENSALRDFERTFKPTSDGYGRFWWQKKGDTKKLPEWIIMDHGDTKVNFERTWYSKCEQTKQKLDKLKAAGYTKDWLESLDDKNDFKVGEKQGWVYP
jgi:hypothetical protein